MIKAKTVRVSLLALAALLVILEAAALILARPKPAAVAEDADPKALAKIKVETDALEKKIGALSPKSAFIVIDSARNTLIMRTRDKELLTAAELRQRHFESRR
jgi:hypothetical protein